MVFTASVISKYSYQLAHMHRPGSEYFFTRTHIYCLQKQGLSFSERTNAQVELSLRFFSQAHRHIFTWSDDFQTFQKLVYF